MATRALPIPALLRRALAPRDPVVAYRAALCAADRPNDTRDWAAAEPRNAAILAINPLRAETWIPYGDALRGLGRHEEATAAYRRAIDVSPENVDAHQRLNGSVPADLGSKSFCDVDDLPVCTTPQLAGRARKGLAFIHLQKTGGMTLHHTLERYFLPWRVCPMRDEDMHICSAHELAGYDFFSGHFDVGALRLLGQRPMRVISVFREPRARLISFYRFHVGHALAGDYERNQYVRWAHEMSAEEFFEHPRVRREPEVFNHYLSAFGLTYRQVRASWRVNAARVDDTIVARAIERVRRLDAIGLQERHAESMHLMFAALGLRPPSRVVTRNETDSVAMRMRGVVPPPVESTPRLEAALEDLICFDRKIYDAAVTEFERRRSQTSDA